MKRIVAASTLLAGFLANSSIKAQEPAPPAEPTKQHEWLEQFVGEWTTEAEGTTGPGQPAIQSRGTIRTRKLGPFWVVSELNLETMGTKITGIQTLRYDAKTRKYVGTWVDSLMDIMWKYEGDVDPSGKILTLVADGPVSEGKSTKFRDTYEFKSSDHIVITSSMLGDDGTWFTFMTGHARRTK